MKVALVTDTHFGGRSDSVDFDNYFRKFYDEVFFPYLDEYGIKTICHLGDCFDRRKFINFNSLKSCREYFFDAAKKRGIAIHLIVGNHDTFYKNSNAVNSPQLLLKDYDNVIAYHGPAEPNIGGISILMLPWLCADNYEDSMKAIRETKAKVCFGHLELAGFQVFKGQESHDGYDPKIFSQFDLVCSGHFHHRHSRGNIVYLGNPYQMFWNDVDDPRGFHVFDTNTLLLDFVENPNTIFAKYYYDEDKIEGFDFETFRGKLVKLVVENKKDFYKFDRFVENIYKQNPIELKILEDMSDYEAENVNDDNISVEDTLTLLSQYVDAVEIDTDKNKLKSLVKNLFVEAQNRE
jgi:DNA repair exonuclease SbcCD nuclease subunit